MSVTIANVKMSQLAAQCLEQFEGDPAELVRADIVRFREIGPHRLLQELQAGAEDPQILEGWADYVGALSMAHSLGEI